MKGLKRLIILSYHALPMDVVSSYRAKAYCDHFVSYGVYPILVTHRWAQDESGKWKYHDDDNIVEEKTATCTIIRLPRKKTRKRFRMGKFSTILEFAVGDLEPELESSYHTFRTFLLDYLAKERVDALLVIYSPHFQMKIAAEMKQRYAIPYITDFRDLWDNRVLAPSYRPGIKKRLVDRVIRYWWARWIREAEFFTTTGELWLEILERLAGRKGYVVRNGFEEEFSTGALLSVQSEFRITHFGRVYPLQDHSVFVEGYRSFIIKEGRGPVLEIIGNKSRHGVEVEKMLEGLPPESWRNIRYKSKAELLHYCRCHSSVLWLPGFYEDLGAIPVKVYDYLLLEKNILLAPASGADLASIVVGSGAGIICDTPEEVCAQLEQWYGLFVKGEQIPYNGNPEIIRSYAR